MLIFEGSDCSGKTTLKNKVVDKIIKCMSVENGVGTIKQHHYGKLPDNFDYCKDYLDEIGIDVVADRFIYSELVYGPVLRGKVNQKLTSNAKTMVELELLRTGSIVVLAKPSMEVIRQRNLSREVGVDHDIESGNTDAEKRKSALNVMEKIYTAFDSIDISCEHLAINNDGDVEEDIEFLIKQWFAMRNRAIELDSVTDGWGGLWPTVLFVGDRYSKRLMSTGAYYKRPFSITTNNDGLSNSISSSSDFVMKMLNQIDLPLKQCFLTNAYNEDDSENIIEQIDTLQPKAIVVMGENAKRLVVDEYGYAEKYPIFRMPHPQYIRRFRQPQAMGAFADVNNFIKNQEKMNFRMADLYTSRMYL